MNDKQLAMSDEQWKIVRPCIMPILTITILILYNLCFYHHYFLIEAYKAKEIYEIEGTFNISCYEGSNQHFVDLFFMFCEPPENREELQQKAYDYLEQNHVIKDISIRVSDFDPTISNYYLSIHFMEPTKFIPIGWKAQDAQEIFGYMEGLIMNISFSKGKIESCDFYGKYDLQ